jgi:formylglycine-generating enzyme required for sulfatase activity
MEASGYDPNALWWDDAGQTWLKQNQVIEPREWQNDRFGIVRPNHPVVSISWYEAIAYCRWLTLHLNDGFIYRLPSELEWEYAACGAERRVYPWGDAKPDNERANFAQIYNSTSAVGCFPTGATPEGLLDMAGNVWEWTRSEYRPYPYDPEDGREDGSDQIDKRFTLRGGGWLNPSVSLRASSRGSNSLDSRGNNIGVRLATHLARPARCRIVTQQWVRGGYAL